MIKAVIYARYSSSSQTEQSIEGQVRFVESFLKEKPNMLEMEIKYYV